MNKNNIQNKTCTLDKKHAEMVEKFKNNEEKTLCFSIRNLRYLSPCSVIANIFEFVGLAVIAYYIFGTPLPRFDDGVIEK